MAPVVEGSGALRASVASGVHPRRPVGHGHAAALQAALLSPGAAPGAGRRGLHRRRRALQSASGEPSPAEEAARRAAAGLPERLVPSPGLTPAGPGRGQERVRVRYSALLPLLLLNNSIKVRAALC